MRQDFLNKKSKEMVPDGDYVGLGSLGDWLGVDLIGIYKSLPRS